MFDITKSKVDSGPLQAGLLLKIVYFTMLDVYILEVIQIDLDC